MQLLRYLVFPFTPVYYFATWFRNVLYDAGIKSSKSYTIPVICIGNLSAGGTGKSPMVEYLVRLLKDNYQLATLSRGYGRQTKGYILADETASASTLGDEPYQFYSKYGKSILVSVCEDRQTGISNLLSANLKPDLILLDDAYQHRKVHAGFSILLTTYSKLYTDDYVLPLGDLREPRVGAKRAQLIVVTKCPEDVSDKEKEHIKRKIKPGSNQDLFFSSITYPQEVIGVNDTIAFEVLSRFTLVTGIANATPLVTFLEQKGLSFNHLAYKDHHRFNDLEVNELNKNDLILTTEKDYMRLKEFNSLRNKLYYIPIEIDIRENEKFDGAIKAFITKTL